MAGNYVIQLTARLKERDRKRVPLVFTFFIASLVTFFFFCFILQQSTLAAAATMTGVVGLLNVDFVAVFSLACLHLGFCPVKKRER